MAKKRTGHYANAYDLNGPEDAIRLYEEWADTYDADLKENYDYAAPAECAAVFEKHCADRGARILDAGCGTGLSGAALREKGYRKLDGLDISAAMLRRAADKGIYGQVFEADLSARLDLPDDSYDAVLSVGIFTLGHVRADALDELVRVVRSGGTICFSVHEGVFEEYGFDRKIDELVEAGTVELAGRDHLDYVRATGHKAWVVTLRVK